MSTCTDDVTRITPAVKGVVLSRKDVLARVNRVLTRRGEKLVRSRGHVRDQVGDYFVVHSETQQVTGAFLNLEHTARLLGVLKDYETLDHAKADDAR